MSATLLSNFILGITLLKNISLRFSEPGKFYEEFEPMEMMMDKIEIFVETNTQPTNIQMQ